MALDCRALHWPGIGRYCRELAAALPVAAPELEFRWLCSSDGARQLPRSPTARPLVLRTRPLSVAEQLEIPAALVRNGIDLLHVPASFTFPLLTPRFVVTVHDLMLKRFPEFLPSLVGRAYYGVMTKIALRRARRVITVSAFTRADVLTFWPGVAAKTVTVWNGVSVLFQPVADPTTLAQVRSALALPDQYILYIGTCKRHKNLPRLLEAYSGLPREQRRRNPLLLVAKPDPRYPEIEATIRRTGLLDDVLWRTGIPDQDLPAVYTLAKFLVLPSLYEGFGLPLAEAMACGTPSLVALAGALPEVGGDACLYANPRDVEELRRGLARLLEDETLRADLAQRALCRAKEFSWSTAASRIAQLYLEALG